VVTEADVRVSRERLAHRAAADRRRFERLLHDGVQQDLIAASVQLQLLVRLVENDPAAALRVVAGLQSSVRRALDRAQDLAREIYPPLLEARGVGDAVRDAARAFGVRVQVDAEVGRHPAEVEAAAYFCCAAALASAASGTALTIVLRESGDALRLELRGDEYDSVAARDFVEAAGGTADIDGGRLTASIPLR
jgi:signal transduction histidine kinase